MGHHKRHLIGHMPTPWSEGSVREEPDDCSFSSLESWFGAAGGGGSKQQKEERR